MPNSAAKSPFAPAAVVREFDLINGLFDCQRNRVPVLAIAAQVPSREIGSGYFQETNPTKSL